LVVLSNDAAMIGLSHRDFMELAQLCARNAHLTESSETAGLLWEMAQEFRDNAAMLGPAPDIGDLPVALSRQVTVAAIAIEHRAA
jgi:hypothetical protein